MCTVKLQLYTKKKQFNLCSLLYKQTRNVINTYYILSLTKNYFFLKINYIIIYKLRCVFMMSNKICYYMLNNENDRFDFSKNPEA